jgi:hypothetical protein
MSNRTAQHTPPAAPPRYRLALVTWAGRLRGDHADHLAARPDDGGLAARAPHAANQRADGQRADVGRLTGAHTALPRVASGRVARTGAGGPDSRPRFDELGARGASQLIIDAHDRVQG